MKWSTHLLEHPLVRAMKGNERLRGSVCGCTASIFRYPQKHKHGHQQQQDRCRFGNFSGVRLELNGVYGRDSSGRVKPGDGTRCLNASVLGHLTSAEEDTTGGNGLPDSTYAEVGAPCIYRRQFHRWRLPGPCAGSGRARPNAALDARRNIFHKRRGHRVCLEALPFTYTSTPVPEKSTCAPPRTELVATSSSIGAAGPVNSSRVTSIGAAYSVPWRIYTRCPLRTYRPKH